MDWDNINRDRDTNGLGPIEYDQSKVPSLIRKHADNVRTKTYGQEVREAQARNAELAGLIASEAAKTANMTQSRQNTLEAYNDQVIAEITNKDVVSAPEIIQARGPYTTLNQRLEAYRMSYSVRDFGAVGNGVTDDTNAIQDTVDYVASIGGGTVFFPVGVYRTTKSIKWQSYVKALGCGTDEGGSGIHMDGTLFSAIVNVDGLSNGDDGDNPDVWLHNCSFENMYIDGAGLTHTASSADGKGLFILYMKYPVFRDFIVKNTIGTGFGCDFLVDGIFDNCHAINCGRNWTAGGVGQSGIGIGTGAVEEENVIIKNCTAKDCGNYGFFVETQVNTRGIQSKYAKFIGCHAENNRINFGNKGSGATQFSTITSEGGQVGLQLTEKSYGDILSNVIINNANQSGLLVSSDYVGDLQLANVKFEGNRKNIEFLAATEPIKKVRFNNVVSRKSQFTGMEINRPITDLSIIGGEYTDNGTSGQAGFKAGILINKDITNFTVDNVEFGEVGTQQIGIQAISTVKLKNGIFSNLGLSAFGQENGLKVFEAILDNVKLRDVLGITDSQSGTGNFGGGYAYVGVTFPKAFVQAPKQVNVLTKGTEPMWATDITRFGFIARKTTTPAANFEWTAFL